MSLVANGAMPQRFDGPANVDAIRWPIPLFAVGVVNLEVKAFAIGRLLDLDNALPRATAVPRAAVLTYERYKRLEVYELYGSRELGIEHISRLVHIEYHDDSIKRSYDSRPAAAVQRWHRNPESNEILITFRPGIFALVIRRTDATAFDICDGGCRTIGMRHIEP